MTGGEGSGDGQGPGEIGVIASELQKPIRPEMYRSPTHFVETDLIPPTPRTPKVEKPPTEAQELVAKARARLATGKKIEIKSGK